MKNLKIAVFIFLLPMLGHAQETVDTSAGHWEGGLFVGYSNYLGDLVTPTITVNQASLAFGVFLKRQLTHRFGLKGNINYGEIEGSDLNYNRNRNRGLSFESSLVEVALRGEYDIRRKPSGSGQGKFRPKIVPYLFMGVGVAFVNPKTDYTDDPSPLALEDINTDYSEVHPAIPLGIGIKFDLSRKVYLGIEWGERLTFTDYLDGVSNAGDDSDNDVYTMGGATLGFRFVSKDTDNDGIADDDDKCPTQPGSAQLGGCPDTDGDGLADRDDNCPTEPGDLQHNGCPDDDGDGVANHVDDCPEVAGLKRFSGCPDTDNDGIVDKEDNCPTIAGLPAMNGCPDSDRDGITDAEDACPEAAGVAEHNGCPDSDDDGIADSEDECPNTFGIRQFNGCPDTDKDGIADNNDKCPTLAGPAANDGCPDIAAEDKEILDQAMRNVNFQFGSARLLSSSQKTLDEIAEVVIRYPGYMLHIDGYTDNIGNDFANQQLSEQRARAAADYLARKGVDRKLMVTKGHGENSPIADNSTAEGRRMNRRVHFSLKPK